MQFGIYHVDYAHKKDVFLELLKSDFVNSFFGSWLIESKENLMTFELAHKMGKQVWVHFFPLVFDIQKPQKMVDVGEDFHQKAVFKPDWQEKLSELFEFFSKQPYYSSIEGLYLDEPLLCGVSLEDFRTVTKKVRELFAGKKMFCCFSIAGVAPDIWTTGNIEPITEKAGEFLTDVSFDMYHKFDEKYAYITKQMKERLGNREDLRIWHTPCVMNYRGDKDEQHCIDHLTGCYNLLMSEKPQNRGGLMCYSYHTYPPEIEALGNIGLDNLRGQSGVNWKRLWSLIEKYGKELCQREN